MASTRVDLPDPMSPVRSAFSPAGSIVQMRAWKVPQFSTSKRDSRNPGRSRWGNGLSEPLRMVAVRRLEVGEPFCIDKRSQDSAHFEQRGVVFLVVGQEAGSG